MHALANLWKVCKRMQNLLEEFTLPKINEYRINIVRRIPEIRLKRVHEELQCIGPYIKKLCIGDMNSSEQIPNNLHLYLQQCSIYISTSLKQLELDYMPIGMFSGRCLESIQPLLFQIESLSINFYAEDEDENDEDDEAPINIQIPKLKELELCVDINLQKKFFHKSFPNLEKAYFDVIIEVEPFLKNNTQLKCLHIGHPLSVEHLFESVAKVSKNLESLIIDNTAFRGDADTALLALRTNEKLTKLILHKCRNISYNQTHLSKVLSHLKGLKQLRTLAVTSIGEITPDFCINLVHELPHLEHFCATCPWTQSAIIEFIKRARYLKTFCAAWHDSECPIPSDFIKTVVEARMSIFESSSDEVDVLNLIIMSLELKTPLSTVNASTTH